MGNVGKILEYKGIKVRVYGQMSLDHNTWYVTEDDEEERILARGFPTFYAAIDYIVNRLGDVPAEVMGV